MRRLIYVLGLLALASIACNLGTIAPTSTPRVTFAPTLAASATSQPTLAPTQQQVVAPTQGLASGNPVRVNVQTTAQGCPPNLATRLTIGGRGRVTPGQPNVLRSQPTRNNQLSSVIGQIPAGGTFNVLGGPVCADGYPWWQVNYSGAIGWTAEGENTTYWVEPISVAVATVATPASLCPSALPARLLVGLGGMVTSGAPNALKSAPGKTAGTTIGQIPGNVSFVVIGGPVCLDGIRWWQVNVGTSTGWTGEGEGTTYWVTPFAISYPDCPNSPPGRLFTTLYARVTPGLDNVIRSGPGKTGTTVIGSIPAGGVFSVTGNPVCGDVLRWWPIKYNGTVGWTAEGEGNIYWTEPIINPLCSGAPVTRLTEDSYGRITPGQPNVLRSAPGKNSSGSVVTGQLQPGAVVSIFGGPVCADGFLWWQVAQYNGEQTGWTAEGQGSTYWIEPYLPG